MALTGVSTTQTQQIDSLVQQYQYSISNPVTILQDRQTSLTARLTALATLRTKMKTLNNLAKDLQAVGSSSKFKAYSIDSSLATVVTGTATGTASPGTHSLLVTQLAKTDKVLSSQLASAATNLADGQGAGVKRISLTVNNATVNVDVTITAGDSNNTVLSNLATAINGSTAGVTASVVTDTTGTNRLVFTSKDSGSAQAISMSDVTGTVLDSIGLGASVVAGRTASTATTGGYLNSSITALDAKFKIDGIDITRGTNSVSDVLQGVTLELKGVQSASDTPVTLTVSSDKSAIKATVQSYIDAYNDVLSYLNSKTSVNPDTKTREIFASDQQFRAMKMNLRTMTGSVVSTATPGNPVLLSDIGIEAASDGTLSLSDTTKFDDALASDVRKISDLFNSSGGIAGKLTSLLDPYTTSGGQIDIAQDGTNNQLTNIKSSLDRTNAQITAKVALFRSQYEALYNTMSLLQSQSDSITSLLTSLYGTSG